MNGYYFHRSDRKIILVLLAIIAVLTVALFYFGDENQMSQASDVDSLRSDSVKIANKQSKKKSQPYYYTVEVKKPELFYFDPNTADSTQLLRLGLQPWQVRNIYKYRANGGIYREPSDFARLYGLTVKQYRALEPYIKISSDYLPASTLVPPRDTLKRDTMKYPVKIKEPESIILNTADTNQLKRVPGIGSWFARAIVNYGKRLGGYVNVGQLQEIEDFPTESIQFFVVQNPTVRRLNINKLSLNELRKHPYINYYQAKTIIDYRRLYGTLKSLDDLEMSKFFSKKDIERLQPYVEF